MWVLYFIYLACLLGASLTGIIYRESLKSRQLSFLPYYLLLVFIQEMIAFILVQRDPLYSTGYIYNIYNPINALVYSMFYYRIPFNRSVSKFILATMSVFAGTCLFTYCCIKSIFAFNNYISIASGFIITLNGILFLFNYFKLDNHTEEKKWLPVIWITIGLVSFYPVVNISFAVYKYLLAYEATILGMKLYNLIPQLMSIFMYVCFIRAFYLCRKKN